MKVRVKAKKQSPKKKFVEPKFGQDMGYGYKAGYGEMGYKETPAKDMDAMLEAPRKMVNASKKPLQKKK